MKRFLFIYIALATALSLSAGGEVRLSLAETIARARLNSLEARVALDELKTAYWQHRSYRAELLPELSFRGTLPSYHRAFSSYMDADGKYSFVPNDYLQLNGELSLTQRIWLTGGSVSVTSSLDFMRQLSGAPYNRFLSIPVALTLNQPIFAANDIKWDRKIEPVRYREARASFLSATEEVATLAVQHFFSLLMDRENRDIASQNLSNATRLLEVAREKYKMGQISRNDLMQMELNMLEAKSELTDRESDVRNSMFRLRTFLNMDESEEECEIIPELPKETPAPEIPFGVAYEKAMEYNSLAHNLSRRQLEADYAVAKAKGDLRQINLFAQVGYTGTSHNINGAYSSLHDNQIVEIGVEIPLLDWGKRLGKVKVAKSNRDVTRNQLRQENQTFRQNLFILVERYGNQRAQLEIAMRADSLASRRYQSNVETYLIGRLSTLDLNDSQTSKDESRRNLVNELYLFWLYYYQLRSLTLWDFETSSPIDADFDRLVK